MISAQQQFVDQLMNHRLGDRYLRLDKEPSQEQASDLGLDVAGQNLLYEPKKQTLVTDGADCRRPTALDELLPDDLRS